MIAGTEQPFDQDIEALRNVFRENDILRIHSRFFCTEKPAQLHARVIDKFFC